MEVDYYIFPTSEQFFFTHVNHISPMYKGLQNWYTNEQSLVQIIFPLITFKSQFENL